MLVLVESVLGLGRGPVHVRNQVRLILKAMCCWDIRRYGRNANVDYKMKQANFKKLYPVGIEAHGFVEKWNTDRSRAWEMEGWPGYIEDWGWWNSWGRGYVPVTILCLCPQITTHRVSCHLISADFEWLWCIIGRSSVVTFHLLVYIGTEGGCLLLSLGISLPGELSFDCFYGRVGLVE